MYRLWYFIKKSYVAIIFIVVEIFAIHTYARSTPYTEARMLTLSNLVVGHIQGMLSEVGYYFSLRRENVRLTERLAELENRLDAMRAYLPADVDEQNAPQVAFEYIAARVVSSSINKPKNFMTLNKGFADGVSIDMAVLSPDGCPVGYIVDCSEHYSVVMSILNTDFKTSGRLATDGNPGSVHWEGGDTQFVTFDEVSKYADVRQGAIVTTTGFSHYFPEGLTIGSVERFRSDRETTFTIRLRLAVDMTRLSNVLLVSNLGSDEVRALERATIHKN